MRWNSITILIVCLVIVLIASLIVPDKTYWGPKYGSMDTDPLGTSILYREMDEMFPSGVELTKFPVYNMLKREDAKPTNYFFVNHIFNPDPLDVAYLLDYVNDGGRVFISANNYSYNLMDTLGFEVQSPWYFRMNLSPFTEHRGTASLFLSNAKIAMDSCAISQVLKGSFVSGVDSSAAKLFEVLGYIGQDTVNFVRRTFGRGQFYIHTCPAVFSNYGLLYDSTYAYASACLSYLKRDDIHFDDYYKSNRNQASSPLQTVFRFKELHWAWNLMLISMILFTIFGARRLARPIPVIKPYQNESLRWIETIGALHHSANEHNVVAQKRVNHLKAYIKRRFNVTTEDWERSDALEFERKTDCDRKKWKNLFSKLENRIRSSRDLKDLNDAIEEIYSSLKKY